MNIRSINIEGDLESKGEKKKRFSSQEKLLILSEINKETTMEIIAEKYNLAVGTLKRWMKKRKTAMNKEDPLGLNGLSDTSTKPKTFSNRLPKATEERILSSWQEHPGLGPSQIHYQLKREGIRASTKAIRKVLIANGYKKKEKIGIEGLIRFEAERPNKLWQMDILDFYLGKLRLYLMLLVDDYSRFAVGSGLFTEATMSHAIITLRKAIRRYGKPENLLTDRGMQFHSWRTLSRFEKVLEALGVEHILARPHHPQTLGKVEALNKRIQNELIEKKNFRSQLEVEKNIRAWVHHYNHSRTHQGIRDAELGSVLVPADRYYGREEEVLAKVRARLAGKEVTPFDYTTEIENLNPLAIPRVAENKGNLDIWFCGRMYQLINS